jgi:peroxiredoxin
VSESEGGGEGPGHRLDPDAAAGGDPGRRLDPDKAAAGTPPRRLDPDRAAQAAARRGPRRAPPPVIDTRRYQRMIGLVGLTLVVVISVALLSSNGRSSFGVTPGQRLHFFAAPLANSTLNGDANLNNPSCTLAKHDPRALNICLIVKHQPLVLAFFDPGSGGCVSQVSALQTLSQRFAASSVAFAAVAVGTSHADAAKAVRSNHWTIPVAYDADGAIREAYGVAVCPIVELVNRGGVVEQRLIGEHWNDPRVLAPQVRALLKRSRTA